MLAAFAGQFDRRLPIAIVGSAVLATLAVASIRAPAAQAADADTPVQLRTTSQFAVLAGAGITNTGTTTIQGDIGSFPTTDQTISGVTLDGTNQAGNAVTQQAKRDLVAAYDEAAGALPPTSVETELGGKTLVGGVYKAATELGLTGTLTLDGGRSDGLPSNKVFIFQAGTTLITEVDSEVVLTGGAQACNIFWQVGSAATFKTRTAFRGTVMAYTGAITAQQGATFVGRLLARDSAVTMDNNTISRPSCVVGPD
ncbi:MAG: ice-binding family protein, partial [Aeromicrobium sp.]